MSLARSMRLGASLYVPATHPQLSGVLDGHRIPHLRSLIVCTEDAVLSADLPRALDHLAGALERLEPSPMLRFVRVRSPAVLRTVAAMKGADRLDGYVLPKVTLRNLPAYFGELPARAQVMLTLETAEVFDVAEMRKLATTLALPRYAPQILSMRIGGNDLLGVLGLRRGRGTTLYDTPIGLVVSQLVTIFRPLGINLTAPVHDGIDDDSLEREVALDLSHGLFGKTAIHPTQVPRIEALYRVTREELATAESVLGGRPPAVFLVDQRMCEPTTQTRWAQLTLARAELYGVSDAPARLVASASATSGAGSSPSRA